MRKIIKTNFGISLFIFGIIILSLFIGFISDSPATEKTRVRWIGVDQINKIIEEQKPVIVDLRTPGEYQRGHISGAINVPIETLRSNRSTLDIYKDNPVLLYCRTINKSDLAIWFLEGRGFKSIYALKGGYEAYRLHSR
jgi:rhodanese-related sulfurtransferase